MSEISNLQPKIVWEIFDEITRVPRPSKKEEKIREYLIDFAKKHSLEYACDATGNVVIRKGATEGYEGKPTVVLQAHMDMVCEKNSDTAFDFEKDPIRTRIDGGWVRAEGTTLGADCGIGMAAALAALIDPSLEHGPIEALLTVDEETGLTGAFGLADNMITGKYLINLDSEDEGEIFIGCAGGVDTLATIQYKQEATPTDYAFYRASVSELLGGHSGDDIDKGRANSNKIIARLLYITECEYEGRMAYFCGGNLRNAIPREAYAIVGVPNNLSAQFEKEFKQFSSDACAEYAATELSMQLSLDKIAAPDFVLDKQTQRSLLAALVGLPNGVLAMSQAVKGLVQTSTNLASVKFVGDNQIVITTSQRSSVESEKRYAAQQIESVLSLAGAKVEHSDGYPGWTPNTDSALLQWCCESYRTLFAIEPKVKAIHAGLECGLFLEKYPQLEMVSFGPTLRGVHSPDERLEIATVDKFWQLLVALLKRVE